MPLSASAKAAVLPLVVLSAAFAGCSTTETPTGSGHAAGPVSVSSSDSACTLSASQAPSGVVTFAVKNDGSQVTEFYLYGEDGLRIVGEVANIGPGITRDLVVTAAPGSYVAACKPGMTGDGIRSDFTVTDSGAAAPVAGAETQAAVAAWAAYVRDETALLLNGTRGFAVAYVAGRDAEARRLYAPVRMHWEAIEPVAESFGDLDPKLDLREADLEPGQRWTGWHRIEKDLWPPEGHRDEMTPKQRKQMAEQLVADTVTLQRRVADLTYTPDQLGNGAKELMDEVATGKVTGEEEAWSHTDLYDFQANVTGARTAFKALEPIVREREVDLADQLNTRFDQVQAVLDLHRRGDGFVLYTALTPAQVRQLARAVDAVGEPLSRLTAVVVS